MTLSRPKPPLPIVDAALTVLRQRFGLKEFRPHQRAVCDAVIAGSDALLVMPTGGGKSLCYQLPGILRGGPTLVISPLIALMEDQTAKLQAIGLRAERIHSGRERSQQQAALRAWLAGELDFLMVAPERLRVPGFVPRLNQRPPALIAIDEAHCISMWGHDFRPDYRLLGERLPELRQSGAPIVAMTATATVRVQQDIIGQLGIPQAKKFIHGFRRDNLAIEIAQCPKPARQEVATRVLADPTMRPAVVYALSRQEVDDLSKHLRDQGLKCAGYHAGMDTEKRQKVQESFASGRLDVIVATVAFGMGIDKANIRTVLHLGLPGSIENWYQEIGRAGRDGLPSHAIALYSWQDRKFHEFLFDKSYPPLADLLTLLRHVPTEGVARDKVLKRSKLSLEIAEAALDKLFGLGAVQIDFDDQVSDMTENCPDWRTKYEEQRQHRLAQTEEVFLLAQDSHCRMQALIAYFGDHTDAHRPCGICDACAPEAMLVRQTRPPNAQERKELQALLDCAPTHRPVSIGKIQRDHFGHLDRKAFQVFVEALERGGWVRLEEASFDKDGQEIRYRTLVLADELPTESSWLDSLRLETALGATGTAKSKTPKPARRTRPTAVDAEQAEAEANPELVSELKAWRKARAQLEHVPAYQVMTDATLLEIATQQPKTLDQLLKVRGMGLRKVEKYGRELLAEVKR